VNEFSSFAAILSLNDSIHNLRKGERNCF
jgi:hypothetical protein